MTVSSSTKFEIPRFNGSNYPAWKLKMHVLIKDRCVVALKGKENKPKGMTNKVFIEKDKLAIANIYLALDEVVLFNMSKKITTKGLWDSCKIYMKENQCRHYNTACLLRHPYHVSHVSWPTWKG